MKIKITRPDGSIVEAEGTAEECSALLGQSAAPAPAPVVVPYHVPLPEPFVPWWSRRYTWTDGTDGTVGAGTITIGGGVEPPTQADLAASIRAQVPS